ncbi:MAG: gliding motility-associated C-terminal domain-containing protein [Ferruginibacter sp.]|nr:gliding motility-associated C-terminal domain-containing protein [Ferruginibacter sp.]
MDNFTLLKQKLFKTTLIFAALFVSSLHLFAQIPANDEPCTATVLTPAASCTYATYTNINANNSAGVGVPDPTPFLTCGNYLDADVWFTVTVPVGATQVVIDTKNLGMSDGGMTVYTATTICPAINLTQLACIDDGSVNPGMPKLTIIQPAGTVLYIRMYGNGGETGTFGICVTSDIPPLNDNCANATALTVNPDYNCGVVTGGTTINATSSPTLPTPTCSAFNGWNDDVWYTFVATNANHRVSILNVVGVTTDMAMSIYSGTCGALTEIACSDPNVIDLTGLTVGNTYYVRVMTWTATTTSTASFNICIGTLPPPPLNDDCTGATSLTVNPTLTCTAVTAGTTQSATATTGILNPSCGNFAAYNDDVWYSFVATSTIHRASLSNIVPVGTGMVMVAYTGSSCGALTEVASGCSTTSPLVLNGLTIGTTYFIRVYTNTSTTTTVANFDICLATPPPPPINDECTAAISLTVNPTLICATVTAGTTESASLSTVTPAPLCGTANAYNDDVWFSFIATSTNHRITLPTVTPATTMVMVAYSGTCAALTEIGCSTTNPLALFGLTIGNTYYVRVYTNTTAVLTAANFDICVTTPPAPPANDECTGAFVLTVNTNYLCGTTTVGTTVSATPSATAPNPTCGVANAWNDDVWFSFVATNTRHRINLSSIVGSFTSMASAVYSGTCAALTQITCSTVNTYDATGLTIGDTYYVRVFTNSASVTADATSFNVCIGSPPPPPANDDCAGAISLTVNPNLLCGVSTQSTVTSATQSTTLPIPTCAATGINDDVWFTFTATAATHRISLLNITPAASMATAVYSGTCASGLTEIICSQANTFHATGLTIGQTYYVRTYTMLATPNMEIDFRICVGTLPPPPPNDECTGAIALPISSNLTCAVATNGTTLGATQSANLPTPSCSVANGWNDDVWYSIVATSTSHRISFTNVVGLTTALATTVYSGTCGSLAQITCNTANAFDANNLVIGNTYYIRVQTAVSTFEDANFGICIGTPAPNKTCATSIPFCNQITQEVNFTSTQGTPSTAGGTGSIFGCLGTTPNQNWFDIYVTTAGPIFIEISQVGGNVSDDVDFCAWGPFVSPAAACTRLSAPGAPFQPIVNIPAGTPTAASTQGGCSYSAAPIEYFKIPNALPGQVYKLLVTNFSTSNNNLPPFTVPAQFVKLKSMIPIASGGATMDCNLTCLSATATNSGPVCPGGTFNLSATGTSTPFSWVGGVGTGGFTSSLQNITGLIAPATPGNYDYTVTVGSGPSACVKTTTLIVQLPPIAPVVSAAPVTYCLGSTAVALTATALPGNTLLWYTVPTGGVGVASFIPPTTGLGSIIYYVSQTTAGGCEGPRSAVTVTIIAAPTPPLVSATPIEYCQNATATALTATASGTNTLLWFTTATGGVGVASIIPQTAIANTTLYYVSQSNGNCQSTRSVVTVTIKPKPVNPTVANLIYCQGATTLPLTATGIVAGATIQWYAALTGGTPIATPTPSNTATSVYYATQLLNGCESSPRVALTTTITPTPSAPIVGASPLYCQGATGATALTATATAGNTLLWYTTASGGVGTTTLIPSTGATNTYYVSQVTSVTLGGCEGPRTPLVVTITPTPALPIVVTPAPYCQGETAAALSATATAGNTLLYYTTATGGTGVSSLVPPTTAVGNITYYVSQVTSAVLGGCEGPRAPIVVTVKQTPPTPIVADDIYCQGATTLPLTATGIVAGATIQWYAALTGGTPIATPTPSNTATSVYYATQLLNGCESTPRVSLTTTITPTPSAPIVGASPLYCQGATGAAALTATATAGNTLLWYTTASGGVGTTTLIPSTGATNTYYVSQVTSVALGGCEGPRTPLVVTITPTPALPIVVTPAPYCQGETAAALSATATAGNTLLYYTTATGGTGVSSLVPPTTAVGNITYYVSQVTSAVLGGCEGPRAPIVVTVKQTPPAPITTALLPYCQGVTIPALVATGIVPGATLLWYTTSIGGTGSAIAPIPSNTANSTYYVSQILNGCEGPRESLTTTITPTPVKPIVVSPIKLCPNEVALPLVATALPGNTLMWYNVAVGGVGSTIAITPSTLVQGPFSFYVSQVTPAALGGCEGPRELISVTVDNNGLTVAIGNDTTICQGNSVKFTPLVLPTATAYTWRIKTPGIIPLSTIDTINIKNATMSPIDTVEYILNAEMSGCSVEDTVKVNVIWKPLLDAGPNVAICLLDSILLKGNITHASSNNFTYVWTPLDSLTTATSLQTMAHPTRSTWYKLAIKTTLAYGCDFSASDSFKLVVQPVIHAFAGNDTIAATGLPHQLHGTGGLHYEWFSPTATITNAFSQNATTILNSDANFYLKVSDAVGCKGFDTIFVKVLNGPTYHIPNAFSPNGDGLNDIFRAVPSGMSNTTYFRVFNRLGELMFETNQWLKGWDGTFKGKPQPNGVYVWMVKGKDKNYQNVEMKGTVHLVR